MWEKIKNEISFLFELIKKNLLADIIIACIFALIFGILKDITGIELFTYLQLACIAVPLFGWFFNGLGHWIKNLFK